MVTREDFIHGLKRDLLQYKNVAAPLEGTDQNLPFACWSVNQYFFHGLGHQFKRRPLYSVINRLHENND